MTLCELHPGRSGTVLKVGGSPATRQRLMDMGLMPSEILRVARVAPAGDPLWIRLEGFEIALRRREAAQVEVQPIEP